MLTPEQIKFYENRAAHHIYPVRVLVALDIFVNVLTGGREDETISSRVYRISQTHPKFSWNPTVWLAKILNAGLNLIQSQHGAKAGSGDLERASAVTAVEDKSLGLK